MDHLHSETLDFLIRTLKAKQVETARAEDDAERKACHGELEHLRKRIALEFYYQTHRKSTGDSPT